MDVLRDYMSRHRVRNNQAHVYINKKEDRARWIVVWRDTPFLIMAPVGSKLEYRVGMTIAADFADTDKLRQEFLNETTNEISELE